MKSIIGPIKGPTPMDRTPKIQMFRLSKGLEPTTQPGYLPTRSLLDKSFAAFDRFREMITSPMGRVLSAVGYLVGLLLVGAIVMIPLEGWTLIQSLYFASFTMTTIGYVQQQMLCLLYPPLTYPASIA